MLDLFADAEPWQEPLAPGAAILRRPDLRVLLLEAANAAAQKCDPT
jgi:alkylated DNA repair dioxygenase AlkB